MTASAVKCRKCKRAMAPAQRAEHYRIGVKWLPKGDCCGACHERWASNGGRFGRAEATRAEGDVDDAR